MSRPDNLPYGWEYEEDTNSVVCYGCGFRYGAEHADGDGGWTCPNCQMQAALTAEIERLLAAERERCAKIVETIDVPVYDYRSLFAVRQLIAAAIRKGE